MAEFKLFFTPSALNDLRKIDSLQQQRIVDKLQYFSQTDNPLAFAVQLSGVKPKTFRFRIGKYRIFFDVKNNTLRVLGISLRDKAYRDF